MSFLKSLSPDAALLDVFRAYPGTAKPLLDFHEALLRQESSLSVAERELIAAFVSGLNACSYCHGIHTATAEAFGVEEGLLAELLKDVDRAPVDEKMKPILRYVQKLTLTPSRMTPADADAIYAVGWDDRALHDAVVVCGLFNLMNRMADGLGIVPVAGYHEESGRRLKEIGYAGLAAQLDAGADQGSEPGSEDG